jgi:hypothetical protein
MSTTRLNMLLLHIDTKNFSAPPPRVGIKTVMDARDLGFVEIEGKGRNTKCRLTLLGRAKRVRRKLLRDPEINKNR